VMITKTDRLEFKASLKNIKEKLADSKFDNFFPVGASLIINLDHIKHFKRAEAKITMSSGVKFYIARNQRKALAIALDKWQKNQR